MKSEKDSVHHGQCLCGNVKYQVKGTPQIVVHCHCVDCQRLTGAGHSTGAMFPTTHFELHGPVAEYQLQSENGNRVTRVFCPSCGSPILGKNTGMEGYVTVSLGTMDNSENFKPEVVVFARNRKPWDEMDATVQTFNSQPHWDPDD